MKKLIFLILGVILYSAVSPELINFFKSYKYQEVILKLKSKHNLSEDEEYLLALSYCKVGEYQKSYELFYDLFKKNMKSVKYNFFLGKCAEKLGKYKLAIAAFERVLIYEPRNIPAKLELAKIYIKTKEFNVAKEYLKKIKEEVNDPYQKEQVDKYIKYVDKLIIKHFYKLLVMLGVNYDTNINNSPINDKLNIYINGEELSIDNSTEKKKVLGFVKGIFFKHIYLRNDYVYSDNLLIYSNTYPKASDNNILFVKYSPSFKFPKKEFAPFFSYVQYGKEPLFSQVGMEMNFKTSNDNNFGIILAYTNYFLEKNDQKDAKSIEIYDNFRKNNHNVYLYAKFQRKIKGSDPNVEYNMLKTDYSYSIKKSGFTFKPGGIFEFRDYLHKDEVFNNERIDRKYSLYLNVDKKFDNLICQMYVKRIWNDSTIDVYEYKKWLAGFNFLIPLIK